MLGPWLADTPPNTRMQLAGATARSARISVSACCFCAALTGESVAQALKRQRPPVPAGVGNPIGKLTLYQLSYSRR